MTTQIIYLPLYDWTVIVYYCQSGYDKELILDTLESSGCVENILAGVQDMFESGEMNTGFTYTNMSNKVSYIYIGPAESRNEFQNTYAHEKGHVVSDIAQSCGVDFLSEEYQYLMGDLSESMFNVAKRYLCDECYY